VPVLRLCASENAIGDSAALALADVISVSAVGESLTSLDLSECGLTCRGAAPLLASLARLPCLTSLSLAGNLLPSPATSSALARFLSPPSIAGSVLTSLDVSHTGLRLGSDLVAGLQRAQVLHSLRMAANRMGEPGGERVLDVLRLNRSITRLDVSANLLRASFLCGLLGLLQNRSSSSSSPHNDDDDGGGGGGQLELLDVRENKFGSHEEKVVLVGRLRALAGRDMVLLVDMHPLRDSALCDGVQEV
jgi:hypothetical protein